MGLNLALFNERQLDGLLHIWHPKRPVITLDITVEAPRHSRLCRGQYTNTRELQPLTFKLEDTEEMKERIVLMNLPVKQTTQTLLKTL